ncbi:hypothetical protein WBG78_21940 [Chryseolinea sp. T2]|uniref:hypothetical protein n=1 Tax=Chryseolinea sp. T2 TaxID=3129255 RepID=UPI003077B543
MASGKGKALLYGCTIISTVAILLIALNIFGVLTLSGSGEAPIASSQRFSWKYFLTFTIFPILIFFNLVFWVLTAVSGRMLNNRPNVRQALQVFYVIVTSALVGILVFRIADLS